MARSNPKHHRAYVDGVDLSGYARAIPQIAWAFEVTPESALTDECKNIALGQPSIDIGALNVMLDNDAAGAFVLLDASQGERNVAFAFGSSAAPAAGDPVFAWKVKQISYKGEQGAGFVVANVDFGGASSEGALNYSKPWGVCLHPKGAETGANTSTGVDGSASSAAGGLFVYHLFSSNGTVTLKAQHADTNQNASFADLTGATSGSIDASSAPAHGLVELATDETIERYTRWQLAFGTATTATFFMALIRA